MNAVRLLSCLVCCLLFLAATGHAQDPASGAETQARQLHRAAVDDFAKGAYLRAVDGFIAADRLTPRAGFLFNIAKSYDASHDVSHALAAYRGYLRQAASAPDATQVAQRVSVLSAQRVREGVAQVSILSEPLGAQVIVDDEPVGSTPITVDLAHGAHGISVSLAGYRELRSRVEVTSDQPVDLSFSLLANEAADPHPVPAAAPAPQAFARSEPVPVAMPDPVTTNPRLQIGGFVSLGAGVVALGAGIAFEVMRARSERSARDETIQTRYARDLASIEAQQTLARVFAGSGVVLAAVGGVMLGLAHGSSERKPASAELAIACAPSDCQGVVSGVF